MLTLEIKTSNDSFDEAKQEFVSGDTIVLELEHSLVSLSKWESKFEKPFLGKEEKTDEETIAYIQAMILTPDYPEDIFEYFTQNDMKQIQEYISAKQTATWFNENNMKPSRSTETITSELIYFWMTSYQIDWRVETWHLNRLFTLIKVFNIKNQDPKKNSEGRGDMLARRKALNEQRRKQLGTKG